jgi:hypothetical protein
MEARHERQGSETRGLAQELGPLPAPSPPLSSLACLPLAESNAECALLHRLSAQKHVLTGVVPSQQKQQPKEGRFVLLGFATVSRRQYWRWRRTFQVPACIQRLTAQEAQSNASKDGIWPQGALKKKKRRTYHTRVPHGRYMEDGTQAPPQVA